METRNVKTFVAALNEKGMSFDLKTYTDGDGIVHNFGLFGNGDIVAVSPRAIQMMKSGDKDPNDYEFCETLKDGLDKNVEANWCPLVRKKSVAAAATTVASFKL